MLDPIYAQLRIEGRDEYASKPVGEPIVRTQRWSIAVLLGSCRGFVYRTTDGTGTKQVSSMSQLVEFV